MVVKHVVGIDVAQKELVITVGCIDTGLNTSIIGSQVLKNSATGFEKMVTWVNKITGAAVGTRYVMEATGVYHESLAYWLDKKGCEVSIVLPNKISNYARTLTVKTVTDKTASEAIMYFGLQRNLDRWKRPDPTYKKLRQLCRERGQLIVERTTLKNQLHAEKAEAEPNKQSIERVNKRISLLNKQEKDISKEISVLIREHDEVSAAIKLICTIPGVNILTAGTILAETNGFELIKNKRQLTSYAGLDVREKQSGTSVKGKPRISKKGNRYIRKALYMPALAALRFNDRFKAVYARLIARNGIKMKAGVAIQRKLLEMMFTIFKTQTPFDSQYLQKQHKLAAAEDLKN